MTCKFLIQWRGSFAQMYPVLYAAYLNHISKTYHPKSMGVIQCLCSQLEVSQECDFPVSLKESRHVEKPFYVFQIFQAQSSKPEAVIFLWRKSLIKWSGIMHAYLPGVFGVSTELLSLPAHFDEKHFQAERAWSRLLLVSSAAQEEVLGGEI